jgi:hypothetical protein
MWYFLLGLLAITWTETHFNFGWPGVARTIVFTLIILGLAAALTRAKVRLRL